MKISLPLVALAISVPHFAAAVPVPEGTSKRETFSVEGNGKRDEDPGRYQVHHVDPSLLDGNSHPAFPTLRAGDPSYLQEAQAQAPVPPGKRRSVIFGRSDRDGDAGVQYQYGNTARGWRCFTCFSKSAESPFAEGPRHGQRITGTSPPRGGESPEIITQPGTPHKSGVAAPDEHHPLDVEFSQWAPSPLSSLGGSPARSGGSRSGSGSVSPDNQRMAGTPPHHSGGSPTIVTQPNSPHLPGSPSQPGTPSSLGTPSSPGTPFHYKDYQRTSPSP